VTIDLCVQADYMADEVEDQTSNKFLEVYLLWLFGWVMFRESAGDSVSRYELPWAPAKVLPWVLSSTATRRT
jgi:hypothetical protein